MKIFQRGVSFGLLLALFIVPIALFAQDDQTITVAGSAVVAPLFEALADASESEGVLSVTINGTDAGFVSLCQNEVDVTTAARPITAEEEANCDANGVQYAEFLLGHNVLAVVRHPELTFAQCLSLDALSSIFEPSAAGQIINWTQITLGSVQTPTSTQITTFLPADTTPLYALLDRQVVGVGLRGDASVIADEAELIASVNNTPGAIGVVSLNAALANNATIADINTGSANVDLGTADASCYTPSAENIENRRYTLADRLFVYVNRASLEKPGLTEILTFLANPEAAAVVESASFTAPTEQAYSVNQSILEGGEAGRQFSLDVVDFEIPTDLFGTLTIGGAGLVGNYLNSASTQFTTTYPSVTSTVQIDGEPAGFRRLCNGEIDIAAANGPLPEETATNCEANNVVPVSFDLGKLAAVLVANADPQYTTDYLACLTTEQVRAIWSSPMGEAQPVTNWSAVNAEFPDVALTLVSPDLGANYTDVLLGTGEGAVLPLRTDAAETNGDPLYRAAAVANVEGGLTYMSWPEYLDVLENAQERIQLVSIDGGNGCVAPSEETIADGSYPLTTSAVMVVRQDALVRTEVQSFLWFLAEDTNYTLLEEAGLTGVAFGDLPELRQQLQTAFAEAQVAALNVGPESTAEATAEATGEATGEATAPAVEGTPEPTEDAEGTPEATEAR
jgi:phosphate transport system substrate-binding protein